MVMAKKGSGNCINSLTHLPKYYYYYETSTSTGAYFKDNNR